MLSFTLTLNGHTQAHTVRTYTHTHSLCLPCSHKYAKCTLQSLSFSYTHKHTHTCAHTLARARARAHTHTHTSCLFHRFPCAAPMWCGESKQKKKSRWKQMSSKDVAQLESRFIEYIESSPVDNLILDLENNLQVRVQPRPSNPGPTGVLKSAWEPSLIFHVSEQPGAVIGVW